MLRHILAALKHNLAGSDLAASLRYRLRYPGLGVAPACRITGSGGFAYGKGCSLAARSRVLLNPGSRLEMGDLCRIDEDAELQPDGGTIRLGEETSVQKRCILIGDLDIGSYCLFAPNVFASSGAHNFDLQPGHLIRDQDDSASAREDYNRRVTIGDDCWIGVNAVIMRGVTIGKGCVIGANSVVTRDVPPYSVAAGSPAKVIRTRLDFVPKVSISAADENDWPYFYAGFSLRKSRLNGARGLPTHSAFSVCLSAGKAAATIGLEISPDSRGEYVLAHGTAESPVGPRTGTLTFPARSRDDRGIYEFRLLDPVRRTAAEKPGLRIARAFLE